MSARTQALAVPLIIAAVSLGVAIHVRDGEYAPLAIALVTLCIFCLAVPFLATSFAWFRRWLGAHPNPRLASLALRAGLAIQFAILFASWPGIDLPHRGHWQLLPFHIGLTVAVLLVFSEMFPRVFPGMFARMFPRMLERTTASPNTARPNTARPNTAAPVVDRYCDACWFPALLVTSLLLGVWMIHSSPAPHIDVWVFQQNGAAELLHGRNPYAMTFPDIYHSTLPGRSAAYGTGLVVNDRLQFGFIYPPLTLLLSTLSYALTGDVRYAQVSALVLAAAFIGYLRPGRLPKLAAALLLFSPRVFFVLGRAWTEPFVVLLLAVTIFLACRPFRSGPTLAPHVFPGVAAGVASGVATSGAASAPPGMFRGIAPDAGAAASVAPNIAPGIAPRVAPGITPDITPDIILSSARVSRPPLPPELLGLSRDLSLGLSLGLLFAAKQYTILALPLSFLLLPPSRLLPPKRRWHDWFRLLWPAFLVAGAVTLPFVLWNPQAFWKSVVTVQQLGPFRWDALTYLVWYGLRGHSWVAQPSVAFLCTTFAVLLALGLALWRAPRTPLGFAAALALAALVFFAFNKQAFANYYFFVIGALCCAIASCGPPAHSGADSATHSSADAQPHSAAQKSRAL